MHTLPREIQLLIVENIPLQSDLQSLSQTCKAIHALVTPSLYHSIKLCSWKFEQVHLEQFAQSLSSGAGRHLPFTRCLIVEDAAPHPDPADQHLGAPQAYGDHQSENGLRGESENREADMLLLSILKQFPDNGLETFRFISFRSLPDSINDYLRQHQLEIRHLQTGEDGDYEPDSLCSRMLSERISSLRILDIAIWSASSFEGLLRAVLLKPSRPPLERLCIRLEDRDWSYLLNHTVDEHVHDTVFPRLKELVLTNFWLDRLFPPLSRLVDVCSLTSLDLFRCDGSAESLAEMERAFEEKTPCLEHFSGEVSRPILLRSFLATYVALSSLHLYLDDSSVFNEDYGFGLDPLDEFFLKIAEQGHNLRSLSFHLCHHAVTEILQTTQWLGVICDSWPNLEQLSLAVNGDDLNPYEWQSPSVWDFMKALGRLRHLRTLQLMVPNDLGEDDHPNWEDETFAALFKAQRLANILFYRMDEMELCSSLRALVVNYSPTRVTAERSVMRHCFIKRHQVDGWNTQIAVAQPVPAYLLRHLEPVSDILDSDAICALWWPGPMGHI